VEAISRRTALRKLGLVGSALAAVSCTPLKVVLRWYPTEFDVDHDRVDRILAAFVDAVVPGVRSQRRDPTRHLFDPRFPLHSHTGYFAADLCSRAQDRTGNPAFERLTRQLRTRVIADGLAADPTTSRLYSGAIYLTQIASYAGIYDDRDGCATIKWAGRSRPAPANDQTYPRPHDFLAHEVGVRGNFA